MDPIVQKFRLAIQRWIVEMLLHCNLAETTPDDGAIVCFPQLIYTIHDFIEHGRFRACFQKAITHASEYAGSGF